jgi:hypothetical protein
MNKTHLVWSSLLLAGIAALALVLLSGAALTVTAQTDPTVAPATADLGLPTETGIPIALSGIWGVAGEQPIAIRSGPGLNFPRIGVLRPGRSIDITGTNGFDTDRACDEPFQNTLDMWVEVRFGERVGWMARCTMTIRGDDLAKLPVEAPPPTSFTPVPTAFPGAQG